MPMNTTNGELYGERGYDCRQQTIAEVTLNLRYNKQFTTGETLAATQRIDMK